MKRLGIILALMLASISMPAQQNNHTVTLAWTQSSSAGVTGNAIYRGTTTGGPYFLLTNSAVPLTTYTDSSVTAGVTYFYVVTAFAGANNESAFSNEAKAVIPLPPSAPSGLSVTVK